MDEPPAPAPPPRPVPVPPPSAVRPRPRPRGRPDAGRAAPTGDADGRVADADRAARPPADTRRGDGRGLPSRDAGVEPGLRALVGAGPSQVSLSAALRARDACRPTAADLAAADRELPIVRRGWRPDSALPGHRA
ncbi:hypothetical protein GCM10010124_33810 [Pilimelia terevasa]|uniref:Uncharacterized protein n=1 Tax=Pilimelia terevasa TaxID=53372 RepID=A0A8J3BPS2_9ACTN|nr:hypothetical protein [Pilimelia terevasa]GGK38224.1 hypothetical protein GCM10010124_33810 [Pilimelia terevasa]